MKKLFEIFKLNDKAYRNVLLLMFILILPTTSWAQEKNISGQIFDSATGEALIGVSVVVEGNTARGTTTDMDGKFTLDVAVGETIKISYISFVTQSIKITNRNFLKIDLIEDSKVLDEIVVVGFGIQKKVNLSGSVGIIDSKALEARPVSNAVTALQGILPGLNIGTSGMGGMLDNTKSINIRGTGSIGGKSSDSPLILIDGMEGDLNTINPQDIDNISVLKDAAASSIYGSRAPFGVILVTTKSGKSGRTRVTYDNNFRFKKPLNMPKMMNSYEFVNYFQDGFANRPTPGTFYSPEQIQKVKDYMDGKLDPLDTMDAKGQRWNSDYSWGNVDWLDEYYKSSAPSQEHNVSVGGGSEKFTYYASANYMTEDGFLRYGTEKMDRYTISGKFSSVLSKYVKFDFSTKFARSDYDKPTVLTDDLFQHIMRRARPTRPLYDPNGFYSDANYVAAMDQGGRSTTQKDVMSYQGRVTITPIKDWNIIGEANFRTNNEWRHIENFIVPGYEIDGETTYASGYGPSYSSLEEQGTRTAYLNSNIYSNYKITLDKNHNFMATAGTQTEQFRKRYIMARRGDLITNDLPVLNLTTSQDISRMGMNGEFQTWRTVGFFGRVNYDYAGKYLVEGNLRYDGTSRFRAADRWVWSPSFSLGWNMMQEEFMAPIAKHVSLLKLRTSYGVLANTNINSWYPTYATMDIKANDGKWLVEGTRPNTAAAPGLVSETLTWEKVNTLNFGLDWAALNNRLTGSFDYFIRNTDGVVYDGVELPAILGVGVPHTNNTDLRSSGWEFQIAWRDKIKDFSYGASFNLSDAQTKVTRFANPTNSLSKYRAGEVIGNIYGYQSIGIAKTQAEMDAHLAKVDQSKIGSSWGAGDMMYADLDNSGAIDNGSNTREDRGDLKVIGNSTPRFRTGITVDLAYKGFDIQMFWQGVLKRDWYPTDSEGNESLMFFGITRRTEWWSTAARDHLDYFRDDENHVLGKNTNAYYTRPIMDWGGSEKNHTTQTHFLQDASYMRLKNLQLGYTLPSSLTKRFGVERLRAYVSGENLMTLTKMKDIIDPESAGIGYGSGGSTYPLSTTYSFGLSVNF